MSYSAFHTNVKTKRGRAAEWGCSFCAVPAEQWAYNHDPLMEWVDPAGRVCSPEVDDYIPLCKPCHREFDNPGGYQRWLGRVGQFVFPRSYGALRRDMTPHIWQE